MKLFGYFIISLLLSSLSLSHTASEDIQGVKQKWEKLKTNVNNGQILAANFIMKSSDQDLQNTQHIQGKLYLWSDGYRIESSQTEMLVFDEVSTVVDHEQQQIIQSVYIAEDDDFAPAKLLQENWLTVFELQVDEATSSLSWTTNDPFETFLRLKVQMGEVFPSKLIAEDQLENRIELELIACNWKSPADSSLFSLSLPTTYELIDLRNE